VFAFESMFPMSSFSLGELDGLVDWKIVKTPQEFFDEIRNPACFAVIYDKSFQGLSFEAAIGEVNRRRLLWCLMTESLFDTEAKRALDLGAQEVLTHPFQANVVSKKIKNLLEKFLNGRGFSVEVALPSFVNLSNNLSNSSENKQVTQNNTEKISNDQSFSKDMSDPRRHPSELLRLVRSRVEEIQESGAWEEGFWPKEMLPKGIKANEAIAKGYSKVANEIKTLFKECCSALGASRITLVNVRSYITDSEDLFSENLLAVSSSDDVIEEAPLVSALLFPQIVVCVEKRVAIVLNESTPDTLMEQSRPKEWKPLGKMEAASMCVPLVGASTKIYAVLFVQFPEKCNREKMKKIEEAVNFLGVPKHVYRQVDFIGRIYMGLR